MSGKPTTAPGGRDRGTPAAVTPVPGRSADRLNRSGAGAPTPSGQTPPRSAGVPDRNANRPQDRPVVPNVQQPRRDAQPRRDVQREAQVDTRRPVPTVTRDRQGKVEAYRSKSGSEVRLRPDGGVRTVRSGDMTIHHGAGNSRQIVVQRQDRTIISANHAGHGYVQRPFAYRGNEFVNRTYYQNGHAYARYYRPYSYRGLMLNGYIPTRYYASGFYGWSYQPWGAPVYYDWGWMSAPWYRYYGGYFTPAAYYTSAAFWLADYAISVQLAADYADRGSAVSLYGAEPLSPAVRQLIAAEVDRQLALERADADALARNDLPDPMAGLPRLLADGKQHVFVLANAIDVAELDGDLCSLNRGDVLRLAVPPPPDAAYATLEVLASRPGSCQVGCTVSVSFEDLQDAYNQMRETISQGLDELSSRAGQGGVPPLPRGVSAPKPAAFVAEAPPPDPQVANELAQQVQAADRVDQEAVSETPEPVTITLGQTIDEVVALMGKPKQIVKLGGKQIYIYADMKITFIGGKVTDVQ